MHSCKRPCGKRLAAKASTHNGRQIFNWLGLSEGPQKRRLKLGLGNRGTQFAVSESIQCAPDSEPDSRGSARHRLQERDAEAFAGRGHDEEIRHTVGVDQCFLLERARESHPIHDTEITRQALQTGEVISLTHYDPDNVMTRANETRYQRDYQIVALVALARIESPDAQQHAFALKAPHRT